MLGSLLAVIAVIVGLVLAFDPEARRDPEADPQPTSERER